MIALIEGTVAEKSEGEVIVMTAGGVGYRLMCSMNTLSALPAAGEKCRLYTHLNVREDAMELYGHRRDVAGYAAAATEFDRFLADFIPGMREGDLLMVTADHGCDPSYTKTTDHTREYVPYLVCGKGVKPGVDLGTRLCFGTIAQTICEYLGVDASSLDGHSVWNEIKA